MPSLNLSFLKSLHDDYSKYSSFVETGTYIGETILGMEPYFNKLFTVELSEKHYNLAKNKYNGNKINFIFGDSAKVFETLTPSLEDNCIFFLDGHWSSGDTAKGMKDCPLVEEITYIKNFYKYKAIIIIDDFRLFGKGPGNGFNEDWSNIKKDMLIEILGERASEVYHLDSECEKDDRLIIHIKSLN